MAINDLRLGRDIRRITILKRDASGVVVPTIIYKGLARRKKGSRKLRPIESGMRRSMDAIATAADDYLGRHEESNAKERDGWLMELPGNVYRSVKKGSKRMKMSRVMSMMPVRM